MGMSTHVVGFVPPDDKWKKMKNAWDACLVAGVPPPSELNEFFGDEDPDDSGVEIGKPELIKLGAVREWSDDCRSGFEVIIDKLPENVKIVRFWNSY